MSLPRDIDRAIGNLLKDVGDRESGGHELEDAWNLVLEWWEVEPVEDVESGMDPYPESTWLLNSYPGNIIRRGPA
jgi:hypothetical protein